LTRGLDPPGKPVTAIIRQADQSDRAFLLDLAGHLDASGWVRWRSQSALAAFAEHGMQEAIDAIDADDNLVLIAEDSVTGKRCGAAHVTREASAIDGRQQAYLSVIVVDTEFTGLGIGRQLLATAEGWARGQGYGLISLEVFAGNTDAIKFYRKSGYVEETRKLVKRLD
jgi:ribosomal protein S18 acetylase RimI-like enzyme